MSIIWDKLIECQNSIIDVFDKYGEEVDELGMDKYNQGNWVNRVWTGKGFRRAHIDVVDARDTKGLWMMHCCVFPHIHNNSPIYGFDVVAGKNKMTGAFHDFSPSSNTEHELIDWYKQEVEDFIPSKQRELPDWAQRIFTDKMLAAGNVKTDEEAQSIIDLAVANLDVYLSELPRYNESASDSEDVIAVKEAQNYYAQNQKQNPHTPRVMVSLGLDEDDVKDFIEHHLFPEI
jgi:phycocyanobilin:ferredoxin oxidoreductase